MKLRFSFCKNHATERHIRDMEVNSPHEMKVSVHCHATSHSKRLIARCIGG